MFILVIDDWCISCEIAIRWIWLDLTDDKSTLVHVMAWCCQAASHYPSQCWPRSMSPYGVIRPQWVHAGVTTRWCNGRLIYPPVARKHPVWCKAPWMSGHSRLWRWGCQIWLWNFVSLWGLFMIEAENLLLGVSELLWLTKQTIKILPLSFRLCAEWQAYFV